jgi:hypothetical protein
MKKYSQAHQDAIFATLQQHYPTEIYEVQKQIARDMHVFNRVRPETEKKLDDLMDRVVEDNKRRRLNESN